MLWQRAFCAFCSDRIWGLGRQGFKCTECKLLVHKKCHKLQNIHCNIELNTSSSTTASHESSGVSRATNGKYLLPQYAAEDVSGK